MNNQRVVVIGSLNYDLFLQVGALPQIGETYQAQGLVTAAGGKGANQAVQCARLGMACAMVGAVGNDSMGAYLLERLRQSGVNTSHVRGV
ncbi:MAG: ribokinase, partial [Clostridiales bacterium]|nr:ribokinase [Clostridiales bacterium]